MLQDYWVPLKSRTKSRLHIRFIIDVFHTKCLLGNLLFLHLNIWNKK